MRKHKSYNYKFTERTHSVKGIVGLLLAVLSIIGGIAMAVISFSRDGKGTVYLGSGGILAMLCALAALVLSIGSVREEKSYHVFPIAAIILSVFALAGWIGVYVIGFLGI